MKQDLVENILEKSAELRRRLNHKANERRVNHSDDDGMDMMSTFAIALVVSFLTILIILTC